MISQKLAHKVLAFVAKRDDIKNPIAISLVIASILGNKINRKYKRVLADEIKKSTPTELDEIIKELNAELGEDFSDALLEQTADADDLSEFAEEITDYEDLKKLNVLKAIHFAEFQRNVEDTVKNNEAMNELMEELWGKEEAAKIKNVGNIIDMNSKTIKDLQRSIYNIMSPQSGKSRKEEALTLIGDTLAEMYKQEAHYRVSAKQKSGYSYYARTLAKLDQKNMTLDQLIKHTEFMATKGIKSLYETFKTLGYSNKQLAKLKELHDNYVKELKFYKKYFEMLEV